MVEEQGSQGTTHPVEVQVQELLGVVTTTTTKTKAGRNQTQMRKKRRLQRRKRMITRKIQSQEMKVTFQCTIPPYVLLQ